ncbi:MAG: hypothetical protein ACM3YE_05005 [Bacteroidota bacterium]
MYLKLDNGNIAQLKAVYIEKNQLCFLLHDGRIIRKEYPNAEIVKVKFSNFETSVFNRGQLLDIAHL